MLRGFGDRFEGIMGLCDYGDILLRWGRGGKGGWCKVEYSYVRMLGRGGGWRDGLGG